MRKLIWLIFCLTLGTASAQTTTASGTVTDSDSIAWQNGTISFSLVSNNPNIPPTVGGVPLTPSQINFTINLDGTGSFSTTVADTNFVQPLSLWAIKICSNTSAPCNTLVNMKITGASQSLTATINSQIQAIRLAAGYSTRAYADVEITPTPQPGGTYYNTVQNVTRQWNGSAWANSGGGGGSGVTSGTVWQREGTVLDPNNGSIDQLQAQEATLIYEGTPQILTSAVGPIFKMWWTCGSTNGTALCYAESYDAEVWTRAASPVIAFANPGVAHGYVFHYNSTYYYYTGNNLQGSTQFNQYTSTNGTTWTLAHSAVLGLGGGGAWDQTHLGNMYVIPSAGTWLMMYEAEGGAASNNVFQMGTATSTDQGTTWVKYSGNPSLKGPSNGESGGPEIHLVGSTYYVWYHCNTGGSGYWPTDICRAHSTDFQTWTPDSGFMMTRATLDEGVNNTTGGGQIGDVSMQQVGNNVYNVYTAIPTQGQSHLKLAIAPYTFAQLVQTTEGNSTQYSSAGSFNSLNLSPCGYWDSGTNTRIPCVSSGLLNLGIFQITGGSQPGFNMNSWYNGSSPVYSSNGIAFNLYSDGSTVHLATGPSGTLGNTFTYSDNFTISPTTNTSTKTFTVGYSQATLQVTDTGANKTMQFGLLNLPPEYAYIVSPSNTPDFLVFSGFGGAPVVTMQANETLGFTSSSSSAFAAPDTAFSRTAAATVAVGNGTNGDASGTFKAATITASTLLKTASTVVGSLPAAATAGAGAIIVVTDANSATIGACTGGGTTRMIAMSDGTSWTCH